MKLLKLTKRLIQPNSTNEDLARKEFILYILLLGSIILSAVGTLRVILSTLNTAQYSEQQINPLILTAITIFFITLFILTKKKKVIFSSYILVSFLFLITLSSFISWGADMPAGRLMYALIITMAAILISTRIAIITTLICFASLILLTYLQQLHILNPISTWKNTPTNLGDASIAGFTLMIIVSITWLYNRELDKSLKRARKSEKALKKERDLLEEKVEKRTKDLAKEQKKRIGQLYHFYEFGQLSGGIFHDLVNHLQTVYLNIEELKTDKRQNVKLPPNIQKTVDEANNNLENVKKYLNAAQKQIKQSNTDTYFSVIDEIDDCISVLDYKTKKSRAKIFFNKPSTKIITYGNKFKLNQVLTNILSNATDACAKTKNNKTPCSIFIELIQKNKKIIITIKDTGPGIKKGVINNIFKPFFTTKQTMGLGLYTTQKIIKKDFKGLIDIKSEYGKGTIVKLVIPITYK